MLPNNCIFILFMLPYGCISLYKGGISLKFFEKIITILITLALLICLYFTGQSVIRTVSRHIPPHSKESTQNSGDAVRNNRIIQEKNNSRIPVFISGSLFLKDRFSPILYPARQSLDFCSHPLAAREISSCMIFFLLYMRTVC